MAPRWLIQNSSIPELSSAEVLPFSTEAPVLPTVLSDQLCLS